MEIPSKYNPRNTEEKWYAYWMDSGLFHSEPDEREPYCIVIPPPNVTGVLHMGHMLNNTIQDVLIRRAKMQGKNTLWVPGTDHASIATEAKVVASLKGKGIEKATIGREKFMEHAWEWKEKHGGIILEQLKRLGASCDWDRTRFTMDEALYESVIKVFVDLYNKGLVYRGVRMVNWDPKALTALSDEEVVYKEVQSKLYYLKYKVDGEEDAWVTIATTRPETILGDTAVCVHPEDERFTSLKGKNVYVPLVNRLIPIIQDEYVDMEFGTGCLKITPAHDVNDYEIGMRHKLDSIDIFNDDGTMSAAAELYVGEDRFKVRKAILDDLEKAGNLVKAEDYVNKVGFSERTNEVIEPKLSLQWFLKMESLAQPALDAVMNDTVKFHPPKFKNTYRHWMENVRDWCISRQLWWGQRIPAYYLPNKEVVVAETREEAFELAKEKYNIQGLKIEDLRQDEDVLDTWFSSWLWPISVFDGIRHPNNPDIQYYYPTNDLITAPDILFFWVARMIMAGLEYRNEIPFENVYLTGMVRDKQGRKMSKSLGNSPDPLALLDYFGADGVRVGMLLTSPAGNDLPFDEALCEQGRNFSNKIWNALRLVKGWTLDETLTQPDYGSVSVRWFSARLNQAMATLQEQFSQYRISEALMTVYKLIWDDFCSWFLEMVKPAYQQPIDPHTYKQTIGFFEGLMKILHPFMPFITEEIWHHLGDRGEKGSIMVAPLPQPQSYDNDLISLFNIEEQVIIKLRKLRAEKNIPYKESIELQVRKNYQEEPDHTFDTIISKLCNVASIQYVDDKQEGASSFIVGTTEFYVPLSGSVDVEAEIQKLRQELEYTQGFLRSINKKLDNDRFVNNAPPSVVDKERKKKADAQSRIKIIEDQLAELK